MLEILLPLMLLPLVIWGFIAYIKALVDAAKNDRWVWFVLMLLMWPIFFIYLIKEHKSSSPPNYSGRG